MTVDRNGAGRGRAGQKCHKTMRRQATPKSRGTVQVFNVFASTDMLGNIQFKCTKNWTQVKAADMMNVV